MHGRRSLTTPALLLSLVAGAANAQPPPPEIPPTPQQPPVRSPTPATPPRIIIPGADTPAVEPVRPNLPPAASQDLALSVSPPLLREGAFISAARAQLVKGKSGRWYAIFEPDASGRQIPPMIVLENSYLAAMERVAARDTAPTPTTHVRISGHVTVYRDRNFLLPTAPPIVERPAAPDPDAAANAASQAATAAVSSTPPPSTGKPSKEPSIEEIMSELDKAVGPRRAVSPSAPAANPLATTAVQEPSEPGVTAGFLTARTARIVRAADGNLTAVLDAGAAGKSEGPLTLLPCQNLTHIEGALDYLPEGSTFSLTGEVFTYSGKRYLLPQMYTINRSTDVVMPTH